MELYSQYMMLRSITTSNVLRSTMNLLPRIRYPARS
jgi:hypothetical protein